MLASVLRTFVPLIVGFVLSITLFSGVDTEALTALVTSVVSAVYWIAVRLLEKADSRFGWLLGYAAQPRYATPAIEKAVQEIETLELEVQTVETA